jgi:hypothetical protein
MPPPNLRDRKRRPGQGAALEKSKHQLEQQNSETRPPTQAQLDPLKVPLGDLVDTWLGGRAR